MIVLATLIAAFGSSFQYGYNVATINSPSEVGRCGGQGAAPQGAERRVWSSWCLGGCLGRAAHMLRAHGGASSEGRGHTQETAAQTQGTCRQGAVGLHQVPGPRFLWRARPGWTQGRPASGVGQGRFERALIFCRQVMHSRGWMGKGSSDIDSVIGTLESFLSGVRNILSALPIRGLAASCPRPVGAPC